MDEFERKDSDEMASSTVRHPARQGSAAQAKTHLGWLSEVGRILPIPLAALIGALVVLKIAEGWVVVPLGVLEIFLFFLIIRLWLPARTPLNYQ